MHQRLASEIMKIIDDRKTKKKTRGKKAAVKR